MPRFRRLLGNAAGKASDLYGRARVVVSDSGRGTADLNRKLVARMSSRKFPSLRQFKYLGSVLSKSELLTMRIALAVFAFSVIAIGARLWMVHVVPVPARGGEYVEAVIGAPSLPNPLYASGSDVDADLARLMYAGLMAETPDGRLVPDLAESYDLSEDGSEYVFRLKDDLTWHDGQKLTVDDILFTLNLIQNQDYKSPLLPLFRGVTGERVDDRTIKFKLANPSVGFLAALTVGILPTHVWQDVPPSGFTLADYNLKPIGAGPFKFKSLVRDRLGAVRSYTMERFNGAATPALLDRVTFRFYPDSETAANAVASRQADGMGFVPLEDRDKIESRHDLTRYSLRLPQYTAVFLNPKNQALWKDDAVRAALVLATPRDKIVADVLHGDAVLAESPILAGLPGYDANVKQPAYDPEAAKASLEKAGYVFATPTSTYRELAKTKTITIGSGKKAVKKTVADGTPIPLKFKLTTVNREEYVAVANALAEAWKAVGFEVEVATVPVTNVSRDLLKTKDYEALLFGEVIGADQDPYPFWHSSQSGDGGFNLSVYANRAVDDALTAGRTTTSTEARAPSYAAVAKKIVADAPAVFLYTPLYPYYVGNDIRGVTEDLVATPADRLSGIRDWYQKTRRAWR